MRLVKRQEILDYVTYDEKREDFRCTVMKQKESRRIHLGHNLTFLFENTVTIHYQIQEMIRVEKIVKEDAICHEIDTYNELLGGPGELGCVLLIEVADPKERDERLKEWLGLQEKVYISVDSGERIYAKWDQRQVGKSKLSSVQYLKFNTNGVPPGTVGVDHPMINCETNLNPKQREALISDLKGL